MTGDWWPAHPVERTARSLIKDYIRLTESAPSQREPASAEERCLCARLDYMRPPFRASLVECRTDTFVAQTDLTRLSCDLVLVPTDVGLHIRPHWRALGRLTR